MKMSQLLSCILVCCCYYQSVTAQVPGKCTTVHAQIGALIHIITSVLSYLVILQSPQNQSVCEGGTATFTCTVMFPSGTIPSGALWGTNNGQVAIMANEVYSVNNDVNGRSAPANVTNMLTVTNVSISDNGADFVCAVGVVNPVASSAVFLKLIGKQVNLILACYT